MVDEFQDTDGLQWSIVEALARPDGPDGDRLFFVGDVKQAIYGFRGGDVQVFNAARRTVRHAVELSTNYRSRPELIAFFNRLFADVLGPDSPERAAWEAPFAPLAAGRKDTAGTVRVATYEGKGTDAVREAAWIARLLQEEVLAEAGPYAGMHLHDTATHPSPPVAILLRRRRHLLTYEAALRARGIPYVVVGGVGFWSRPEVVDVANVLHGLARQDPISLVGALRSPLFCLTDQDLWDLASEGLLARFADGDVPAWLPGADRLRAAQAEWRALTHLKDHVSIGELIQAVLVLGR
ncbi:MAG: UvrD-helicase domain-containing protein, partial [Myxococcota bacterium]